MGVENGKASDVVALAAVHVVFCSGQIHSTIP